MAIEIVMPKLSDTMEEGKILKWLKKVGDTVEKDEPLFDSVEDAGQMHVN